MVLKLVAPVTRPDMKKAGSFARDEIQRQLDRSAGYSLLERKSVDEIRRSRTRQLLPPLVVGVFLIVPSQIYLSQFNAFPDVSYWEFREAS